MDKLEIINRAIANDPAVLEAELERADAEIERLAQQLRDEQAFHMGTREAVKAMEAEIERLRAALDESELSHIICGMLACDCPGDEYGAHVEKAKCWMIARAERSAAGLDEQYASAEEKA